ncbi:hypothetical protein TWF173_001650 [Orbilia oligospora]|nr:hypothetical protein TWF173_001650 [Orbilia oligospora]
MAGYRLTWWQLSVDGRQPYGLTAQWPITGSPTESNPAVLTAQWPDSDLRKDDSGLRKGQSIPDESQTNGSDSAMTRRRFTVNRLYPARLTAQWPAVDL